MRIEDLAAYEIISRQKIHDLRSEGYLLRHKKSGARIALLSNEDENKVFYIGFKTPPADSTGVAHILEHSVLEGSKEFPVKDPFIELVKGSMNTFLNAMTYPDKTMYPVASCNDKDFANLMHVYMDAVFYPDIYKQPNIFYQEGWHYEMENASDELKLNGVVYNEMKGAFSSPDDVLDREIVRNLFPDTIYANESGGDPDVIPNLTYEQFLDFHRKYYHPANSYIFLYGDMDIDQTLAFIDGEYLSQFRLQNVDSTIGRQAFPGSAVKSYPYGIASGEKTEHKTLHSLTYVIDQALDPTVALAFKVLTYVLLQSPAAPLKKALVDAGLGKDISGDFQDGILQPLWSISVNGSDPDKQDKIMPIVTDVLRRMVKDGLDKTLLTGALNRTEFTLREADFAGRPKGLIYAIRCMDTWLYDLDPLDALSYEKSLDVLRKGIDTGYFEDLIQRYILDNAYYALVSLVPEPGLTEKHDKTLAEKLAAYKASLTKEEIDAIVAESEALKQRQATPDSPEALESIPTLSRDDLEKKIDTVVMHEEQLGDVTLCHVPDNTNGITYVNAYFDLHGLTREEISYAYLLSDILGDIDTKSHTYGELASLIDLYTGGIGYSVSAYSNRLDNSDYTPVFRIKAKGLALNFDKLIDLLREISLETVFTNQERLIELVDEIKAGWDMDTFRRGHTIVMHRVLSYVSPVEAFCDAGEFSYYEFITDIAKRIKTDADEIGGKLASLMEKIFSRSALTLEMTASDSDWDGAKASAARWTEALPQGEKRTGLCDFGLTAKNEGIMTSGTVQYVAKGGNFRGHGYDYTGALMVLDTILQYGYLWTKVRVQGGAYGAFTRFYDNGDMVFCSYRDPNLRSSVEAYDGLADYLKTFDVSDREMTKYVIGTLSRIDVPLTPSLRGEKAMTRYFTGTTDEVAQARRDQLLATTAADIKALSPLIEAVMKDDNLCVMGSEATIRQEKDLFTNLVSLPD